MADDDSELERLRRGLAEAQRQSERDGATIDGLRRLLDDQRREAEHQVRNILAIVRSLARRTVAEGETAEDYQSRLDSRLASFTRLQAHILRNPPRGVDLCTLISDELLTFRIVEGAQLRIDGADLSLRPRPASVLGLAFHELACMAVDGSESAGADVGVEVSWRTEPGADGPRDLHIVWDQTGQATQAHDQPSFIFGREFLERAVTYELGGEVRLDTSPDRLTCRFRLPAEGLVVA